MNSWVNRRSFPIVTVERINATSFRLRQESFLAAKSAIQNQGTGNSTQVVSQNTTAATLSGINATTFNKDNATSFNGNMTHSTTIKNNTKQLTEKIKRSEIEGEKSSEEHEKNNRQKNETTDDTLWSIPFTYVTNIDAVETLVWFDQKGIFVYYKPDLF